MMTRKLTPLACSLALAAACAEQRAPIDRTQPNALEKSFFVGEKLLDPSDDPEFWYQGTLIDVGYGASQSGLFTSTYAQPVSRIKWVIQEDLLIARLTYERIDGADGKGAGPTASDGIVVAAFDIISQFDIRPAYNPLTGEQMNVLEENTTDRPWHERQYIRVDWSKNKAVDTYDFDTLSQLGVFGGVEYEPLAYYVNDPEDQDAPHFEDSYFDITTKAFAKPQMVDLSHLGWSIKEFPACFLPSEFSGGTNPAGNCNPVELTIRHSFRQVEDTDYAPQEWDGFRFQAYGAFYTERLGYNRRYGMSDEQWHRFINRYNIWDQSHFYTDFASRDGAVECFTPETTPFGASPHRDEDGDGTADECAAVGGGSQCDEFKQRCTLPYADRGVRPIVWYYSDGSHPDFFDSTADAAQQWDVAMRTAVQSARYAECMRVERSAETCGARYPMYFEQQNENEDVVNLSTEVDACRHGLAYSGMDCNALADQIANARGYSAGVAAIAKLDEMVVLCHSPVIESDHALCGERGLVVRMGDLRYHQVNVIPIPQTPSPWGIYTDSHDPLTGETIAASINVWSHVNDLWSQGIVDKIRYIGGELSTEEITDGKYIQDWVKANNAASGNGLLPRMSKDQLDHRIAAFAKVDVSQMQNITRSLKDNVGLKDQVLALNQNLTSVRYDAYAPSTTRAVYDARRQLAIGSPFEAELNTRMMQQFSGLGEVGNAITGAALELSSPLRGNHPSIVRDIEMKKQIAMAEHGACVRHEAPAPSSLSGLADLLQVKFGAFDSNSPVDEQQRRMERMRNYLAKRAHFSVILHEMGHSIGMRHNFVSSSDAYNYRPQYWQLRTNNGQTTTECTDVVNDGESCVGPRWFDPMTTTERDQLLWMFMQSSTMDYAGEQTQDLLGLGAYDFAAARMFYGDVVSVFADDTYEVGTPRGSAMAAKQDNFGGIVGYRWSTNGDTVDNEIHYSQLNAHFDLINDCYNVNVADYVPSNWDVAEKGEWHPVLDGGLVAVGGAFSRCHTQPVDYVSWRQLRPASDDEAGGFSRGGNAIDTDGRVRVPYGFGTDRWADLGNLAVYRHDNGADAYELFNFFITEQEVNHIFDNYRRGRTGFSVRSAAYRTLGRYNAKMRDGAKGLGLFANIYRDFALSIDLDYNTLWPFIVGSSNGYNGLATNVLAAGLAFDHFTRMMARPEPGDHFVDAHAGVLRSAMDAPGRVGETVLTVPNGPTGGWDSVGIGGKPIENALSEAHGEYDSEYTINAGSYYDKVFSTMLLTESEDNYISASRGDFTDARARAVSLADLFPDGYRRWLANNLTNDDAIKGSWVQTNSGEPMTEPGGFPLRPLGWTSWWTSDPEVCFPSNGSTVCSAFGSGDIDGETTVPAMAIDPQVGWEQQKFLIAWTLMYLPENQQRWWLDQMSIWNLGDDSDPGFENRIELHDPAGRVYIAKTFGKEDVFGHTVHRGVAARMLEYGNELLAAAYETDPGPDIDNDGTPDWYVPRVGANGKINVRYDPTVGTVTSGGLINTGGRFGCNSAGNSDCKCEENRACVELSRFVSLPGFMRQAMSAYGMADPSMKGLY